MQNLCVLKNHSVRATTSQSLLYLEHLIATNQHMGLSAG